MKLYTVILLFSMLVLLDAVVTLVVAQTDSLAQILSRR